MSFGESAVAVAKADCLVSTSSLAPPPVYRGVMPTLQAHDLRRVYGNGDSRVEALRGVSLEVAGGEFLAVVGPSGCGKTTLLHLCGGMDQATAGTVAVDGVALGDLDDDALTGLRRERVGFVFQFFNLLPTLTLAENIALPLLLAGVPPAEGATRAREGAERVGLGHRLDHFPAQVSGGELQRAAVGACGHPQAGPPHRGRADRQSRHRERAACAGGPAHVAPRDRRGGAAGHARRTDRRGG